MNRSSASHTMLDLALTLGERPNEAHALRVLGDIAAAETPPDVEAARTYYDRAMILARELGMRPLVAHCHLGLARLYRRAGTPHETQAHVATAATMYREMGMKFWLAEAEAESAEPRSR